MANMHVLCDVWAREVNQDSLFAGEQLIIWLIDLDSRLFEKIRDLLFNELRSQENIQEVARLGGVSSPDLLKFDLGDSVVLFLG